MDTTEIIVAFLKGFGRWKSCSWPTEFGRRKLDLAGVKSSQAALMAGATSGDERTAWLAAARWLDQVEKDAREAEEEAVLAADLAILGQSERAVAHAKEACRLESQYTADNTWRPLLTAITTRLESASHNGHERRCSSKPSNGNTEQGEDHVCGKCLRSAGGHSAS
jgi:hypothetical protein